METYLALTQALACLRLLQKRLERTVDHLKDTHFDDLEVKKEILRKTYGDKEHVDYAIRHVDYLMKRYLEEMD